MNDSFSASAWAPDIPLVWYIDFVSERHGADHMITVALPEYVPEHWYQHILHGQTALQQKAKPLFRPNTATVDVPKHPGRRKNGTRG